MLILGVVLGSLTTAFVQGSNAELRYNNRVQAQLDATLALARLRRDAHCASDITPTGAAASITMTQPSGCPGGGGSIQWCTVGSGTRYGLYRTTGITCDATAKRYADYLTAASVFDYAAPVSGVSLGTLHLDMTVNLLPAKSQQGYRLIDDVVLRNTLRG